MKGTPAYFLTPFALASALLLPATAARAIDFYIAGSFEYSSGTGPNCQNQLGGTFQGTFTLLPNIGPPSTTSAQTGTITWTANNASIQANCAPFSGTSPIVMDTAVFIDSTYRYIQFRESTSPAVNAQFALQNPIWTSTGGYNTNPGLDRTNNLNQFNCPPSSIPPAQSGSLCSSNSGQKFILRSDSVLVPSPLTALALAPLSGIMLLRKRYASKKTLL